MPAAARHDSRVATARQRPVAKLHKLGDRLETPGRLAAKDAGDIYRLLSYATPEAMATNLRSLLRHPLSDEPTRTALTYAANLFRTPRSPGTDLAVNALQGVLPAPTVTAFLTTTAKHSSRPSRTDPGQATVAVTPLGYGDARIFRGVRGGA